MMKRRKSRVQFLVVARLALAFCSAKLVAQVRSNAKSDFMQAPTPVTLWMEWQRGDPHYGSNFILLHTPCQNSEDGACQCQLSFKVINSEEFADCVSSFGDTKIPVMYEVVYGPDGSPRGTRLGRL